MVKIVRPRPLTLEVITSRCGQLHPLHDYRDVRDSVFDGDYPALLDAAVEQALPEATQRQVEETLPPRALEIHLLRRILRALQEPAAPPRAVHQSGVSHG